MGPIRSSMAYCGKRLCDLHTCEKVMEFFSIQIVYFFQFILVFIRDIREGVNINYANFYWISMTDYT